MRCPGILKIDLIFLNGAEGGDRGVFAGVCCERLGETFALLFGCLDLLGSLRLRLPLLVRLEKMWFILIVFQKKYKKRT